MGVGMGMASNGHPSRGNTGRGTHQQQQQQQAMMSGNPHLLHNNRNHHTTGGGGGGGHHMGNVGLGVGPFAGGGRR